MTHANIADLSVKRHPSRRTLSGLLGILLLAVPSLRAAERRLRRPTQPGRPHLRHPGQRLARAQWRQRFSQAEINYPLTGGDRVYIDNTSFGELQTSGVAVRLGNGADVTLSSLTDNIAQFGLAQGSLRVRTRSLASFNGAPATVEVDTPNGAILVDQPGDVRVDSYPQDDTTVVTVSSGAVEVTGQNLDQQLGPNQSLRLAGSNPVYAEQVQLLPPDGLDQFDQQREQRRERSYAYHYVSPDMIGAADLDEYGDWQPANQDNQGYGAVWYPRDVPAAGRRTRTAIGPGLLPGAGPGLRPNRGALRRSTTDAGPTSEGVGAGYLDRLPQPSGAKSAPSTRPPWSRLSAGEVAVFPLRSAPLPPGSRSDHARFINPGTTPARPTVTA